MLPQVIDKNSGTQYACKFLKYTEETKSERALELEMMGSLDQQNIIQVRMLFL